MKKLTLTLLVLLSTSACSGKKPQNLGVKVHRFGSIEKEMLAPCNERSNCVTSYPKGTNKKNVLAPIKLRGDFEPQWQKLIEIIKKDSSANILINRPYYLYVEYKSSIFGFVDDVEFFYDQEVIHFRSASRVGKYDFDVNRKRMNSVQFQFVQQ